MILELPERDIAHEQRGERINFEFAIQKILDRFFVDERSFHAELAARDIHHAHALLVMPT